SGNVGVGTTTPWARFSVEGGGTGTGKAFVVSDSADSTKLVVQDNGVVSVGTTLTSGLLNLGGALNVYGGGATTGNGAINFSDNANGSDSARSSIFGVSSGLGLSGFAASSDTAHLFISSSGSVGIGTGSAAPAQTLHVASAGTREALA